MDIGTAVAWLQAIFWIVAGITWVLKMWRGRTVELPNLPVSVMGVAILIGLAISSASLYFNYRPRVVTNTVTTPYEFAWTAGNNGPSKQVFGRPFQNERVVLDDTSYVHCTFDHVTFVYNGTGPIGLSDNTIEGPLKIDSQNPTVTTTFILGYITRDVSVQIIDRTGKPMRFIEPIKPTTKPQK